MPAAVFLTTLGHYVVWIGASPSLLLRGSSDDAVPELPTLLPPLLLAFASECAAMCLGATREDDEEGRGQATHAAGARASHHELMK